MNKVKKRNKVYWGCRIQAQKNEYGFISIEDYPKNKKKWIGWFKTEMLQEETEKLVKCFARWDFYLGGSMWGEYKRESESMISRKLRLPYNLSRKSFVKLFEEKQVNLLKISSKIGKLLKKGKDIEAYKHTAIFILNNYRFFTMKIPKL